ncbi:putative DNA-binding domain-containing protein [Neptunomonas phycophila]|uniref:HvfC/BufC family peptide modification chaperone n=1 Tax=Neptunomonas phycophila TaxID=1572645 RepID=UPI001BE63E42|nr:DNA-binding domain-containing protein [Neptunomonas phycophila]
MNSLFKTSLLTSDARFLTEIKAPSEPEKDTRFNVYRNNVIVSLIDALADIFPVTLSVVGEDFFRAVARLYVVDNPPTSPVISEYGGGFSDFVRRFEPANRLPYLADLLALEHSMLVLTHNEEFSTLDQEAVAQVFSNTQDPGALQLSIPPTSQILASPFAIGSLYLAHVNKETSLLHQLDINQNEYLLLVKSHLYAQLHVIQEEEAVFIKNLMHQKKLEAAIPPSETFDLAQTLAKLIEWKIITHITQHDFDRQ